MVLVMILSKKKKKERNENIQWGREGESERNLVCVFDISWKFDGLIKCDGPMKLIYFFIFEVSNNNAKLIKIVIWPLIW